MIHDQGYRRYAGRRLAPGRGWRVIARNGIRDLMRQRQFILLLVFAWSPFIVRAVQTYIAENFKQAEILAVTAGTFREFLDQQSLFVFFVTIYVGAGAIANDRRANALQLYLSRPVTRIDYLAGKMVTLLVFLLGVTWLPAMLLVLLQVLFAGDASFLRNHPEVVPAITLFSLVQVCVSSFAMLALSSLSRSSRFVGITYAGLVFFTSALNGAVLAVTHRPVIIWLSPVSALEIIGETIFRTPSSHAGWAGACFVSMAAVMALAAAVLDRRVRPIEVVT